MQQSVFSPSQVADLLSATTHDVADWIGSGLLPFLRYPDGRVRITRQALLHFLSQRGVDCEQLIDRLDELAEPPEPDATPERQAAASTPPPRPNRPAPPGTVSRSPAPPPPYPPGAGAEYPPANQTCCTPQPAYDTDPVDDPSPAPDAPGAAGTASAAEQVLEQILRDAAHRAADAVHLDQTPDGLRLQLRVDGVLQDKPHFAARLPEGLDEAILSLLRQWAQVEAPGAGAAAAIGRFELPLAGRHLLVELTEVPAQAGPSVVLALTDPARPVRGLTELGVADDDAAELEAMLSTGWGLVLLAGTPGPSRRALLRAGAARLVGPQRRVVTIEFDWSGQVPGACQLSFGRGSLRRGMQGSAAVADLLSGPGRLDADAVVLDDASPAGLTVAAASAGLEGGLVLAGMSWADIPAAAGELVHRAGPDAALALRGAAGFCRLRRLCEACSGTQPLERALAERMGMPENTGRQIRIPRGCEACGHTGYAGWLTLLSVFRPGPAFLRALDAGASVEKLTSAAEAAGYRPLSARARQALRDGLTAPEELLRQCGQLP